MSKSAGNFVTIHELLRGWKGQAWAGAVLRWNMLQTNYRQPMDWTYDNLLRSRNELSRMFLFARERDQQFQDKGSSLIDHVQQSYDPSADFIEAMEDDLNTSLAISIVRERAKHAQTNVRDLEQNFRNLMLLGIVSGPARYIFWSGYSTSNLPAHLSGLARDIAWDYRLAKANDDGQWTQELKEQAQKKGLILVDRGPNWIDFGYGEAEKGSGPTIDELIELRLAARAAKNWQESDRIRDELATMGIALKDNKDGTTTWEVKR
jgi:cysteinyl-tRNA synthetase